MIRDKFNAFYLLFLFLFLLNNVSGAHFIVGYINDSRDGTSPNGMQITLFNPVNNTYNITDLVGASGNSGTSNFYMFDCEMLNVACQVGDNLSVKIYSNGAGYYTNAINITVTGDGYDFVNESILNSPTILKYINLDDDINNPFGEIDLIAGGERNVYCSAVFYDADDEKVNFMESNLFDNIDSSYGAIDDKNNHYSNDSCINIQDMVANTTTINCSYKLSYFANNDNWNCSIKINYSENFLGYVSNLSFVNKLLSFSIPDEIDYGNMSANTISVEKEVNISNFGNTMLNLSLYGYGAVSGDNLSLNCSGGVNISIENQKYNLTNSNSGVITFDQLNILYKNLSSNEVNNKFDLGVRQDDFNNEAINSTYWRIYVPSGVSGRCSGHLVFGARQS